MTPGARAAYHRAHYELRCQLTGRKPRTPAAPIAAHIQACINAGMTARSVAIAAGLSDSIVRRILNNPDTTVQHRTRARLLAVNPATNVTPTGLARRVRALAALGWSAATIAEVAGLNVDTIKGYQRGELPAVMRDRPKAGILTAYAALHMRAPAPRTAREAGTVARVKARAARNGWAPPLAWDNIDDPAETPDTGDTARGLDLDEWARLVRWGVEPEVAAERCGVTLRAVKRAAYRHDRPDIRALTRKAVA